MKLESLKLLKKNGCAMDAALMRCVDDEEFLLDCIKKSLAPEPIERLEKAIEEKDADKIFEASHYLKGSLANVGLTPLSIIIDKIVEPARHGICVGFDEAYDEFLKEVQRLKELLKEA